MASFRHFAWYFFVCVFFSSFHVAFFPLFRLFICVISSFCGRYFVISSFCVALFHSKKTKRQDGINQPPYHGVHVPV